MSTPTITEFLEARIAEDEAAAEQLTHIFHGAGTQMYVSGEWIQSPLKKARFLAEFAAKRAILEVHPLRLYLAIEGWDMWECQTCEGYPCDTLKALASAYKDHPDYRQEWAL